MRIYVASSWRNEYQPETVTALRAAGHDVYDFRRPAPGNSGVAWSDIDPKWQDWTTEQFRSALEHPVARYGFTLDMAALESCEACVLVLPCGRSAHLECGWAAGAGRLTLVYSPVRQEPELMYAMLGDVFATLDEVVHELAHRQGGR